jgi:hypothetical protein
LQIAVVFIEQLYAGRDPRRNGFGSNFLFEQILQYLGYNSSITGARQVASPAAGFEKVSRMLLYYAMARDVFPFQPPIESDRHLQFTTDGETSISLVLPLFDERAQMMGQRPLYDSRIHLDGVESAYDRNSAEPAVTPPDFFMNWHSSIKRLEKERVQVNHLTF